MFTDICNGWATPRKRGMGNCFSLHTRSGALAQSPNFELHFPGQNVAVAGASVRQFVERDHNQLPAAHTTLQLIGPAQAASPAAKNIEQVLQIQTCPASS